MKIRILFVFLLLGLVIITGCSDSQSRYSGTYTPPQQQNQPVGGGCGVTAPLEGNANMPSESVAEL